MAVGWCYSTDHFFFLFFFFYMDPHPDHLGLCRIVWMYLDCFHKAAQVESIIDQGWFNTDLNFQLFSVLSTSGAFLDRFHLSHAQNVFHISVHVYEGFEEQVRDMWRFLYIIHNFLFRDYLSVRGLLRSLKFLLQVCRIIFSHFCKFERNNFLELPAAD